MRLIVVLSVVTLAACSSTSNNTYTDSGVVVTDSGVTTDAGLTDAGVNTDAGNTTAEISIASFTFTPLNLTIAAGGTVTVHNNDGFAHTVTSQSAIDQFTPGAVSGISFDTGDIAGGGTAMINIPANAAHGTVIPFYCKIHTTMMGSGTITVQ